MKLHLPNPIPIISPARARRGMALVITLIMLSVTLVMAIAFLAVSNRERAAVTTSADEANARLALDAALNAAQAQILANVIASGSGTYNFGLLVSTNFINSYGFVANDTSPTNINFDYRSTGAALQAGDFEANVANLLYLPRAPVMVSAAEPNGRFYLDLNRNGVFDATGTNISYVDATGTTNGFISQIGDPQWIGALERPDTIHSPNNLFTYRYAFIAVPIGNGLDINYMHNQASTKTVNTSSSGSGSVPDGFLRNQGVGSWEINLAAFLADLNTNQWLPIVPPANAYYSYNEPGGFANDGVAFDDARSLLSWRYGYSYGTLAPASSIFFNANLVFPFDNIDEYGDGPPQTTTTNIFENLSAPADGDLNPTTARWAGSDNTNRFFDLPFELFDPAKSSSNFVSRLTAAGTNTINGAHPTYDAYTFYRLLAQLGTDSTADDLGKIDLNYSNAAAQFNADGLLVNIAVTPGAQTNLVPWVPSQFFTIAVDRMLHAYTTFWFESNPTNYLATYYGIQNYPYYIDPATGYGLTNTVLGTNMVPAFGITNIPVMIGGQMVYSPAVNRIMQLAANIYDASTNGFFPSVYRPDFFKDNLGNVFVTGYEQVTNISAGIFDRQLTQITNILALPFGYTSNLRGNMQNIYGIPWIVGAKKNLPSFNQLYTLNAVQVTRKMQVWRNAGVTEYNGNSTQYFTNQAYIMSVTNHVGYSLWNSYTTNYPGVQPTIVVNDYMCMVLSNSSVPLIGATNYQYAVTSNSWPGSSWDLGTAPQFQQPAVNSFVYGGWDFAFQPQGVFQFGSGAIAPYNSAFPPLTFNPAATSLDNLPQMDLLTTNYVQAYILDRGHIIDYVQLDGPGSIRNLNTELLDAFDSTKINDTPYLMWVTNGSGLAQNGPNYGVINQIRASQKGPSGVGTTGNDGWQSPNANMPSALSAQAQYEADYFRAFFVGPMSADGYRWSNTDQTNQVPYTPTRTIFDLTLWQANDPLVHYLASDLTESNSYTGLQKLDGIASTPLTTVNQHMLGQSGNILGDDRYQPWGFTNQLLRLANVDVNAYNLAYRDPMVFGSDDWDFPANSYPNVGWLGRVHRGTPWQTVYLKATNILNLVNTNSGVATGLITWMDWSGNGNIIDAKNAAPVQDDILFDVFTTALDDNTSRGTLSINQTHLADWSALLSGVSVLGDVTPTPSYGTIPTQTNILINPAGPDTSSPLYQIVQGTNGINATRLSVYGGAFTRMGDILRVPALTEQSPFLGATNAAQQQNDVSDEMYERIPQQIMGLLRIGSPRYVIFCYGQALRPAQDGIALDLAHNGLVTNYQVVAQSLARAVVSVHPQVTTPVISPTTGNYVPVTNYTTSVDSYNLLPPN